MKNIDSDVYPAGPSSIPVGLTKPSAKYKRHAWLAVCGVVIFVTMYLTLASWFCWTAYRLIASGFEPGGDVIMAFITGLPTAFLAIFMVKALFFIQHGKLGKSKELTPGEEPKLFEFLYKLADDAGAPRPHKVFISPDVNACVFYDLSILNLFFPSKKNLEIGLGLVNVLDLSEIKAVLAHEFGHFAQKSMAVSSWVYVAHQVAAHIVGQRGILDRFLRGISGFDFRVAWIGWILRLIVWSIRSLIETIFSLVVISERALSREMEFQADLVSVSLAGSDALVHALHKLHAADEAWGRTLEFIGSEGMDGRAVSDAYAIQTQIIEKLGVILNDPSYGHIPPLPERDAAKHRIFKQGMATPPRMWATHPENFAREENAKLNYIRANFDDRKAWSLFKHENELRKNISLNLVDTSKLKKVELKTSIKQLDKQYNKAYFFRKFRGAYLGRSVTRYKSSVEELYGKYRVLPNIREELLKLYPESLTEDLEKLKKLYEEKYTLEGIKAKILHVHGGIIRFRGKSVKRKELSQLIVEVSEEIVMAEKAVQDHDIRCRTAYLAAAHKMSKEWEQNLLGLLSLLHYADHCEANLRDAHGSLKHLMMVITADDRVTKKELAKLLTVADEAHKAVAEVYEKAGQVQLGSMLSKQMEVENWKKSLGEFELVKATKENINDWLVAIDGWIGSTLNALSVLSAASLENLLKTENYIAKQYLSNAEIVRGPKPPRAPTAYTTLKPGEERKRDARLSLWDRFYSADGLFAGTVRFAVAASIVGGVIFVGHFTGGATITIYNGLAKVVKVDISGKKKKVSPYQYIKMDLPRSAKRVVSTTINDHLVEKFSVETTGGFSAYVYNVAQAAPMVEWTQVYGNAASQPDREVGAPRWFSPSASILFHDPPESVKTKGGGATRTVLTAVVDIPPRQALSYVTNETEKLTMIKHHLIWDDANTAYLPNWMAQAAASKKIDISSLLEERLKHYRFDVVAMRWQQDYAVDEKTHDAICEKHRAFAKKDMTNANLQYISTRCIRDEELRNESFIRGAEKWPNNSWFNYAAGYRSMELAQWAKANQLLSKAIANNRSLSESVSVDVWRLKRFLHDDTKQNKQQLSRISSELKEILRFESGRGIGDSPNRFYSLLNKGDLKAAITAVKEMEYPQRSIRLLAASDGAPSYIVKEAVQLDANQGIDRSTVLIAWSLAVSTGKDSAVYEKIVKDLLPGGELTLKVLKKVRANGPYKAFEKDLTGLTITGYGYAYAAACVLLREKAPAGWKEKAKRILYTTERPYFAT